MLCPDSQEVSLVPASAPPIICFGMTEETKNLSEPGMFLEIWPNFFFKV